MEYEGHHITVQEALEREEEYDMEEAGNFLMFFKHNDAHLAVDATMSNRMGKFVNHSRKHPNLAVKVKIWKGLPRVVLISNKDIKPGEELVFDYGEKRAEKLKKLPWIKNC